MPSGIVSIPSSVGSSTVFSVSGTHTLAYTQLFQTVLDNAINGAPPTTVGGSGIQGNLNIQIATASGSALTLAAADTTGGISNLAVLSGPNASNINTSVSIPAGYQYLFDNINGASTVEGTNAGHLYSVVEGTNAAVTFYSNGPDNTIVFVDGNNIYNGMNSTGGDLVVAGTGFDSIYTGTANTSVFSGTGNATIVLNDTTPVGVGAADVPNDVVVLEEGHATVTANGTYDAILSLTEGQTIFGGTSLGDRVNVYSGGGNDLVVGNGGQVAVEGYSSGNTVFSGSGSLFYTAGTDSTGAATSNTVEGTNGGTLIMFGADSTSITYSDDGSLKAGAAWFVAGSGNETLNGANSTDGLVLFGANSSVLGSVNDSIIGGSGADTFLTGIGNETLTGGAGANQFLIASTGSANNILITDFGASATNMVGFEGYTSAQITAALDSATQTSDSYGSGTQITLDDGTTVTFIGVSSLTGHVQ